MAVKHCETCEACLPGHDTKLDIDGWVCGQLDIWLSRDPKAGDDYFEENCCEFWTPKEKE